MIRISFAVLLAVAQTAMPLPGQAPDDPTARGKSVKSHSDAQQNPSATSPVKNTTKAQEPNNNGPSIRTAEGEEPILITKLPSVSVERDWIDRLTILLTGLLVLVGIGGICVATRTLRAIEKQVGAMIDSARPWIVFSRIGNPPDQHGWYDPQTPQYVPGTAFEFRVIGTTPARIIDSRFNLLPVPIKENTMPLEPNLPELPDYAGRFRSPEIPADGRVVVPGQAFQIMVGLPRALTIQEWESLRDERTLMCVYGCIKYRDAWKDRETAVCYIYRFNFGGVITATDGTRLNPPGFEIWGSYNRTT